MTQLALAGRLTERAVRIDEIVHTLGSLPPDLGRRAPPCVRQTVAPMIAGRRHRSPVRLECAVHWTDLRLLRGPISLP